MSQMRCLLKRNRIGIARDPLQSKVKIGQQVFFAVLIAIIFNKVGFHNDDQELIVDTGNPQVFQNQVFYQAMQVYGAFFFLTVNTFMMNLFNTLLVFQNERPVFLREQANKMYGVTPYFFSKVTMDTPILVIAPLIANTIMYFFVDLYRDPNQFFSMYLTLTLVA
mmetsp:Transcript_21772/g.33628  ORF Transcript_21772/g.33628 Transcript_21772/m.33628 type:complete len:165 (+) Transcript_21772:1108-1602(+)